MAVKVGIPRGLFYFKFNPMWKTFFEELGAELLVSPPTNRTILDEGVKCCVDEACLPVKVFHGHVEYLKDKCDVIFIPRYTSITRNEYICPKFGGLPDMVRQSLKDLPPVIDTEINLRKSPKQLFKAACEAGRLIKADNGRISRVLKHALEVQADYDENMKQGLRA